MTFKQIKKALFDLRCINGAMYFGCVETPCSGRETGECCQNEQTWEEAEAELKSFLKRSFIKYLNGEVDWLKTQYQDEHPVDCIDGVTPVETYGYEETYNQAIKNQITHLQAQIKEIETCK